MAVWTREELETMARLCEKHGVKVISDEIHMDMVWDEHRTPRGARWRAAPGRCSPPDRKASIFRRLPALAD
jgi:aspartate/methionine/tyrosine aminotransferase